MLLLSSLGTSVCFYPLVSYSTLSFLRCSKYYYLQHPADHLAGVGENANGDIQEDKERDNSDASSEDSEEPNEGSYDSNNDSD